MDQHHLLPPNFLVLSLSRVAIIRHILLSGPNQIRLDMYQKNILLSAWCNFSFLSFKQIIENHQVLCIAELWGKQEAEKEILSCHATL